NGLAPVGRRFQRREQRLEQFRLLCRTNEASDEDGCMAVLAILRGFDQADQFFQRGVGHAPFLCNHGASADSESIHSEDASGGGNNSRRTARHCVAVSRSRAKTLSRLPGCCSNAAARSTSVTVSGALQLVRRLRRTSCTDHV